MIKKIEKTLEFINVLLIAGLVVVINLQIFSRLMNESLIWTEELSRFVLVYITFLGASLAFYKGENLRITMIIDNFSPKIKKLNDIVMFFLSSAIVMCLIYFSLLFTIEVWDTPSTALQWNKGLIMIVLPVGFSLILIKLLKEFKNHLPRG
jgi:TRAP-type C4-dicarboxylate transport system permease small subunit